MVITGEVGVGVKPFSVFLRDRVRACWKDNGKNFPAGKDLGSRQGKEYMVSIPKKSQRRPLSSGARTRLG